MVPRTVFASCEIRASLCIFSTTYRYFVKVVYFQKQSPYFLLDLGHFLLFVGFMDIFLLKPIINV